MSPRQSNKKARLQNIILTMEVKSGKARGRESRVTSGREYRRNKGRDRLMSREKIFRKCSKTKTYRFGGGPSFNEPCP